MDRAQLNLIRPPPLLPLLHRNPLPSPCKRDQRQRKRKPRSQSVTPTKNPKAKAAAIAPPRDHRPLRCCLDFAEYSIYSKSPPPSSLPLPGFALVKPKTDGLRGFGLASGGGGDGVDAGATAGLRRLLGL